MSASDSILTMNREACSLLCGGDATAASKILVGALPQLRDLQGNPGACCMPLNTADEQLLVKPMCIGSVEHQCATFRIYNFALHIHGNKDETAMNQQSLTQISAILLYNTALSFQLAGMAAGAEQNALKKALTMYDMALSLVDMTSLAGRLLLLACLNNKGSIMAWFCEHGAVQECLGFLHYILSTPGHAPEIQCLGVLEIQMNVALLFGEHCHAPAA